MTLDLFSDFMSFVLITLICLVPAVSVMLSMDTLLKSTKLAAASRYILSISTALVALEVGFKPLLVGVYTRLLEFGWITL